MAGDSARQVAMVTGADRGLGLALVAGLAEQGWRVFAGQFMADWPELGEVTEHYPDQVTIVPLDAPDGGSADSKVVVSDDDWVEVNWTLGRSCEWVGPWGPGAAAGRLRRLRDRYSGLAEAQASLFHRPIVSAREAVRSLLGLSHHSQQAAMAEPRR